MKPRIVLLVLLSLLNYEKKRVIRYKYKKKRPKILKWSGPTNKTGQKKIIKPKKLINIH